MHNDLTIPIVSDGIKPYHLSQSVTKSRKVFNKHCACGKNQSCRCKKSRGGCETISLNDTIELLSRVNYKIHSLSEKVYNNLVYKHPLSKEKEALDRLLLYRESLLRYKSRLIRSENLDLVSKRCIKNKAIQAIFEKTKHLLGINYSPEKSLQYYLNGNIPELEDGLVVDSTGLNSWLVKNPYCAPVDQWEKLAYYVCGKLNIDIEVEEIKCNLTFEIIKESIPLEVLSGLSIGKLTKNKGYYNKRTPDECKLDWELLVEEQQCDIDYDVYIQLVKDCNLNYDIVAEAYKCGLSFKVEDGQCILEGKNFSYKVNDINFNSPITSLESLEVDGLKLSNQHIVDNQTLENFLSDYHLSIKQLKKL